MTRAITSDQVALPPVRLIGLIDRLRSLFCLLNYLLSFLMCCE
jgi:hypothetical protein